MRLNHTRTSLIIPEALIDEARRTLGFNSKTDTVVYALREVVRRGRSEELKSLLGTVKFEFDPTRLLIAGLASEIGALVWSLDADFNRLESLGLVDCYEPRG